MKIKFKIHITHTFPITHTPTSEKFKLCNTIQEMKLPFRIMHYLLNTPNTPIRCYLVSAIYHFHVILTILSTAYLCICYTACINIACMPHIQFCGRKNSIMFTMCGKKSSRIVLILPFLYLFYGTITRHRITICA